jgi:hypothetical protein
MTYLPGQQQPGQNVGVVRQDVDPRAYQPRQVTPLVRVEPPMTNAPTLGQYFRSDTRGIPGSRRVRWPGRIAFWLGLASLPMLWLIGTIFEIHAFAYAGAAFSVVAIFFGLVAFVTGAGRGLAFWGILFALAGNIFVISFLLTLFGN